MKLFLLECSDVYIILEFEYVTYKKEKPLKLKNMFS